MAYLLDANVLISAKRLHYGFDFCPAFWSWLVAQNEKGIVYSIERVGDEVLVVDDELAAWARARGAQFFLKPDAKTLPSLSAVSAWASGQAYRPAAVNTFLQEADYYLVAQAHAGGHIVVTHERHEPSVHVVKIPSVCLGLGVKAMNPYEMLRRERARFVLGKSP